MSLVKDILENIIQEIDLSSISRQEEAGAFFIMLNSQPLSWKPFETGNRDINVILKESMTNDNVLKKHLEATMIRFSWKNESYEENEITLGLYRFSPELDIKKVDDVFLQGVKQGVLSSLNSKIESKKQKTLFDISKKLHSSIEEDQVLQVTYESIQELYHNYEAQIWISHDHNSSVPVKKLSFLGTDGDPNTAAFVTGETVIYETKNRKAISAPIRGNQGTYGVLQLVQTSPNEDISQDVQYISILADTVGTALENAKLYQQSQRLITQLKLINETSEQLSKTLDLEQNTDFMLSKILATFKPEGIHFLSYSKGKNEYVMVQTSTPHLQDKILEFETSPFLKKIHDSKEPFISSDVEKQDDNNLFQCVCDLSYRSIMIVPMIHNQQMAGMIILTHSMPNYFSYDDFRLLQTIIHHASFAFVNSSLHQEVNRMVITDNLTRLYARSYLDQEIPISQKSHLCGSFILIDIDNFKKVNDTYGHQVGDDILIQVSNVITSSIRDSDIAARWGGEELAIYLPNVLIDKALVIAERIRERVSRETSPRVTISCGISTWEQQDQDKGLNRLFLKADQSLYKAKESGKNRVIVHE
jgi:diguanylate cyclase (GGDEF)-like protein